MVKIGINGFGRLGRLLLKVALNKCKQKCAADFPKVVMVNDPFLNPDCTISLLKNDSVHGKSDMEVVEMGSALVIDGQRIEFTRERAIEKIPWKKFNAEYIIDTTGDNVSCEKASLFLNEGVKRVVITDCSAVPMFIIGVNHCCYDLKMKTISAATPQLNCLMPLLRILDENFEIVDASVTALHPLNNHDKLLDDSVPIGCPRNSRGAMLNFCPTESNTKPKFIERIMPMLEGKVGSSAIRLPFPVVGAIDLTARFDKEAPYEIIKCRIKDACDTYMKNVVHISTDDLVSGDIIGNPHSCIVDSKAGFSISKCVAKIFTWYDSETAFANRLYDLTNYISSRENCREGDSASK